MMFYEEETKVRKAAEESGQCNMRTVTTEDNPYKVAGDMLRLRKWNRISRSVDLYGSSVGEKKESAICSNFILRMKVVQEISPYIEHFRNGAGL